MEFHKTKSKKPCKGCPFKRENNNEKPNPGGSHPFVYLGQARGPFWLPCHADKNYQGKGSNVATVSQCRGAAIFRSNCDVQYQKPEQLLKLPADKEDVFANEAEFVSHYLSVEMPLAKDLTDRNSLDRMMYEEITKPSKTKRVYKTNE